MTQFVSNNVASGAIIYASDHNEMGSRIADVVNGNLDDGNIASVSGSKLSSASVPSTALDSDTRGGWLAGILAAPNTVTYNGNRSYDLVFNSVDYSSTLSAGMRLRTTRTTAAPTQCTDLESGSTQYWSKSSPSGITFTDDFTVMAWVKLESYVDQGVVSRYNGTSGWSMFVNSNGTLSIVGYNAGASNYKLGTSLHSLPLGKWVHIAATLDMNTGSPATSTMYFDGVTIPVTVTQSGTNPTALVQAGDINVGARNAAIPFDGKIAQAALFDAVLSAATIRSYASQTLSGSETNCIGCWTFNGNGNDSDANANNLSAAGSATATSSDSPFGVQASGSISSTLDYGIVMKVAFSTNTTVTVQVPEGCTIPTSGGVTSVAYSPWKSPNGMPQDPFRWDLETLILSDQTTSSPTSGTYYNLYNLTVPVGTWYEGYEGTGFANNTTNQPNAFFGLSSSTSSVTDLRFQVHIALGTTNNNIVQVISRQNPVVESAQTVRYLIWSANTASHNTVGTRGATDGSFRIFARPGAL